MTGPPLDLARPPRLSAYAVREFAIENLSYDLVVADERIASLETDVAVLRVVLVAAFDALRSTTLAYDRCRAVAAEERDAYRRFREDCLVANGADEAA